MLTDEQVDSTWTFIINISLFLVFTMWAVFFTRMWNKYVPPGNSLLPAFAFIFFFTLTIYFLVKWAVKGLKCKPPECTGYMDTLMYRMMDYPFTPVNA